MIIMQSSTSWLFTVIRVFGKNKFDIVTEFEILCIISVDLVDKIVRRLKQFTVNNN
jgi:hypothetical protein